MWRSVITAWPSTRYGFPENAEEVFMNLTIAGYSYPAIIGVLANMEHESYINPGQQEIGYGGSLDRGYGLVQWTPARDKIYAYANSKGISWDNGPLQMEYFHINVPASWGSGSGYSYSYEEFKQLNSISEATRAFFYQFERGTWSDDLDVYAAYWDNYFADYNPYAAWIAIFNSCEIV